MSNLRIALVHAGVSESGAVSTSWLARLGTPVALFVAGRQRTSHSMRARRFVLSYLLIAPN